VTDSPPEENSDSLDVLNIWDGAWAAGETSATRELACSCTCVAFARKDIENGLLATADCTADWFMLAWVANLARNDMVCF